MDFAVVLPTYNERDNVPLVISRLAEALEGFEWEAIFVDDDSPDGTAEVIAAHAGAAGNIRLIQRVGRRGLASACIEGMMSTQAPFVAIMDADMQHDERMLPEMFRRMRRESLDVIVGTRNAEGGSMGEFGRGRVLLSGLGRRISHAVCRCELTDPMSGFFMLRRGFLLEVVHDLQGGGFKILVDLLSSARRPLRLGEVGYTFKARRHGESKLDIIVGIEYLSLIVNKMTGGLLPGEMTEYLLVGGSGLLTHLAALMMLIDLGHVHFVAAQVDATCIAMVENFLLNNLITFRDCRLRGARLPGGLARFGLACSFGAWANVVFARALWQADTRWYLAGMAGIVLGSVWNLSISSLFTWKMQRRAAGGSAAHEGLLSVVEVSR